MTIDTGKLSEMIGKKLVASPEMPMDVRELLMSEHPHQAPEAASLSVAEWLIPPSAASSPTPFVASPMNSKARCDALTHCRPCGFSCNRCAARVWRLP